MTIQPGQRLTFKTDGGKATALKVSKDGKRVYAEFWVERFTGPKLWKMWVYADSFMEAGA